MFICVIKFHAIRSKLTFIIFHCNCFIILAFFTFTYAIIRDNAFFTVQNKLQSILFNFIYFLFSYVFTLFFFCANYFISIYAIFFAIFLRVHIFEVSYPVSFSSDTLNRVCFSHLFYPPTFDDKLFISLIIIASIDLGSTGELYSLLL